MKDRIPTKKDERRPDGHDDVTKEKTFLSDVLCNGGRHENARPSARSNFGEVFLAFLSLGLRAFGGPIAHLGYFRAEFVERRRWLGDAQYAELVALCQFLPGPASSQAGIALGLLRAGWSGALAAWIGFTLPSALLMVLVALGVASGMGGGAAMTGAVNGLKIVAVAVVAQAILGMWRSLCPDRPRSAIAATAAIVLSLYSSVVVQIGVIVACGLLGWRLLRPAAAPPAPRVSFGVSRRAGAITLVTCGLLLALLPLAAMVAPARWVQLMDGFYRAGALVFGGGHVVLPLLQAVVVPPQWLADTDFLAGYGAAQAVPGPLFTFAAYLGAMAGAPLGHAWSYAAVALAAIFLPAFLLVAGTLPFWERLQQRAALRSAIAGINAGVVGILLAALYHPLWTTAIHTGADFALALAAFALLVIGRTPALAVVALACAVGALRSMIG